MFEPQFPRLLYMLETISLYEGGNYEYIYIYIDI